MCTIKADHAAYEGRGSALVGPMPFVLGWHRSPLYRLTRVNGAVVLPDLVWDVLGRVKKQFPGGSKPVNKKKDPASTTTSDIGKTSGVFTVLILT